MTHGPPETEQAESPKRECREPSPKRIDLPADGSWKLWAPGFAPAPRLGPGADMVTVVPGTMIRALTAIIAILLGAGCGESSPGENGAPPSQSKNETETIRPLKDLRRAPFGLTEVAVSIGVDFRPDSGARGHRYAPEHIGCGGALFDADGDEDLDLLCLNGGPLPSSPEGKPNALYLNDGNGRFRRVVDLGDLAAGEDYGVGCAVADIDKDGDEDLFITNFGVNRLYLNDGRGTFSASPYDDFPESAWSASAAFGDLDGDGLPELWVTNYLAYRIEDHAPCYRGKVEIYCGPQRLPGVLDAVYRNLGDGRFERLPTSAFDVPSDGKGLGVAMADFDRDGDLDVYVANDQTPNHLYRNDGDFRFVEVGGFAGVQASRDGRSEAGMGVAFEDLNGDHLPDVVVTNFENQVNSLYLNEGDELFREAAWEAGLGYATRPDLGWGISVVDLDLDGHRDLAVANGHVYDNAPLVRDSSHWKQPNRIFFGRQNGRYRIWDDPDSGAGESFSDPRSSRGLATGDIDGDGDSDLVVFNHEDRVQIFRNDVVAPALSLRLRSAQGAPVRGARFALLGAGHPGHSTSGTSAAGGSYLSATSPDHHLMAPSQLEAVVVTWPDGEKERFEGLAARGDFLLQGGGRVLELRRDLKGRLRRIPIPPRKTK